MHIEVWYTKHSRDGYTIVYTHARGFLKEMQWLRPMYKHKFGIYNYVQTQGGYNEPLHSIISITIGKWE